MSVKSFNPTFHRQPDIVEFAGTLIGAGTSDPTVQEGTGFTAARSAEGKLTITLADTVQDVLASVFTIGATDPDAVKGYTPHPKLVATNNVVEVWIYNASNALDDLETAQHLHFVIKARNTSIER